LIQRVELVRDVPAERNVCDVLRAVGVATRLDVHVRLEKHEAEERTALAFGGPPVRGLAVERAHRCVETGPDLLIDVEPEVLPVVAAKTEDDTFVPRLFDGGVEVRRTLTLPHRRVAGPKLTGGHEIVPEVVV